jgi:hypothetical protein
MYLPNLTFRVGDYIVGIIRGTDTAGEANLELAI